MTDSISDERSGDAVDKIQYDNGIPDDVIDDIAKDVTDFEIYKIQSYVGKSGRQIDDDIPDNIMNDITDDVTGLIEYKLKLYVRTSGYSGHIPCDIKTVIFNKIPDILSRKLLDDISKSAQNSDMLNEPVVGGILNLDQSLYNLNITFAGKVTSIGVDSLDSAYKKYKIYGVKMQHQNNRRCLTINYAGTAGALMFMGDDNEIIKWAQVKGLKALKLCRIDGYKYKDTLDDFIARHGKPGDRFEDKDSGNLYYKYYYDDTRRRYMLISASDDYTIDEIAIFND